MEDHNPEYQWEIGDLIFQVWEQYSRRDDPPVFALKVIGLHGEKWISHKFGKTDTVMGCAFQAMCWLEDNHETL